MKKGLIVMLIASSTILTSCNKGSEPQSKKADFIEGWSLSSQIDGDGSSTTVSSKQTVHNEQEMIFFRPSFECNDKKYLRLSIKAINSKTKEPALIKTHFAKSGFGSFRVANVKFVSNSSRFNLTAIGGETRDSIYLYFSGQQPPIQPRLRYPSWELIIPMANKKERLSLDLNNPNIQKVFSDCQFKPAFLTNK
jgi:hypothetical protein